MVSWEQKLLEAGLDGSLAEAIIGDGYTSHEVFALSFREQEDLDSYTHELLVERKALGSEIAHWRRHPVAGVLRKLQLEFFAKPEADMLRTQLVAAEAAAATKAEAVASLQAKASRSKSSLTDEDYRKLQEQFFASNTEEVRCPREFPCKAVMNKVRKMNCEGNEFEFLPLSEFVAKDQEDKKAKADDEKKERPRD